jgi:hypothetical protein
MNVSAGIGVIGVGKTMINEIFGDLAIVTAVFAGTYVLMISVFTWLAGCFGPLPLILSGARIPIFASS